jgi:DNA-binding NtrC family response regulator
VTFSERMRVLGASVLLEYLIATNWNVTQAAKLAGRDRSAFYLLLKKHGIKRPARQVSTLSPHIKEWSNLNGVHR